MKFHNFLILGILSMVTFDTLQAQAASEVDQANQQLTNSYREFYQTIRSENLMTPASVSAVAARTTDVAAARYEEAVYQRINHVLGQDPSLTGQSSQLMDPIAWIEHKSPDSLSSRPPAAQPNSDGYVGRPTRRGGSSGGTTAKARNEVALDGAGIQSEIQFKGKK